VAVVLTLVQTKQIRIYVHKRNNKKHSINKTKHTKYKYAYYQTPTHYKTHTYKHPHIREEANTTTVHVKTNTAQDHVTRNF